MTCSRIVTAITATAQSPVAVTWTPQEPVAVECCHGYIPVTPTQYVSWIPLDEEIKAALLDPWDGESFVGPADVFRVVVPPPSGGGGTSFSGGDRIDPPIPGAIDDGNGGIVEM